jgi:hypothetical protein
MNSKKNWSINLKQIYLLQYGNNGKSTVYTFFITKTQSENVSFFALR